MDMVAWPGRDAGSEGGNAWRWNMESASAVRLVAEDVSSFGTCTFDLFTPLRSTTDSKGGGEDNIEHPFFFVLDHANPQSSQHHLAAALP